MSRTEGMHYVNVAHFFDHYFLMIFPTAALAIAPAWGMTYGEVLWYGWPVYVFFALGTPVAGWLGDTVDKLTLIAIFYIGCGLCCLGVALSKTPFGMGVWLGLLGVCAAIYHPVGLAWLTGVGNRTGRALAINGVFGNLGLAGATAITGVLAHVLGWQAAFAVPGALSCAIGLVMVCRTHHVRTAPTVYASAAHAVVEASARTQRRVCCVVGLSALFGGLIFNGVTVSLPKVFDERLMLASSDLSWIGASAGLVFAMAAFAQLPVGELLDRIGARPVLCTVLLVQLVCLVALSRATGLAAFVLSLALVTFIFAQNPISTWLLGRYLAARYRSRAVSVEYMVSLGVASLVVPLMAGLQGWGIGFGAQYLGLAMCALIVLVAALFLPSNDRGSADPQGARRVDVPTATNRVAATWQHR